jgi:signal transduction histidine kinase
MGGVRRASSRKKSAPAKRPGIQAKPRRAELEAQLARAHRTIDALQDVARALGTPTDLDELLDLILDKARELVGADRATLYLLEEGSRYLASSHVVGGRVQTIRVQIGEGIAGTVAQTGKPIRVADAYRDKRFSRDWDTVTGYRTRSILAVPMKIQGGQLIGVLQVLNKAGGGPFTMDDQRLLSAMATQAGISIDNTRLYWSTLQNNVQLHRVRQKLERKVADLNLLFDLESAMVRASSQHDLVREILVRTVQATRTRKGEVAVMHPADTRCTLYRVQADQPDMQVQDAGVVDGPLGRSAREGCTVRVWDDTDTRPGLAMPLLGDDGVVIGSLGLFDRLDGRPFSDDDMELLRLVAANASTAINLLRSREANQRNDRMSTIGTLLSGVLHDLKGPLTVISGYVQLMERTDDRDQRRRYTELVLSQLDNVTAMQKEVLAFARGERSVFMRRVYLTQFFDDLRAQIDKELEGRQVAFDLVLEDRGTARFDQVKMLRALHNLVRNALEAMGSQGGRLRIVVSRDGADLVLTVIDTGPGIPKEVEGRLFETFVTAGKQGGTGLGLAVVKKIVEEHGGTISVSSTSQGATFTIRLPQAG